MTRHRTTRTTSPIPGMSAKPSPARAVARASLWIFTLGILGLMVVFVMPASVMAAVPGDALWIDWVDGADHALDSIATVAEAPDGSLYAAGVTDDDWSTGGDMLLIRKTPNGAGDWSRLWDGPAANADRSADLVVDGNGNAILLGTSVSVAKQEDWALVKYSPTGDILWQTLWGGTGSDTAIAAVGDAAGNIYACGTRWASATATDWKVIKFRAGTGARAWTCTYSSPAADHSGDMPLAMDRDGAGNLYVSGTSVNTGGGRDILVMKVSSTGKRLWTRRIDGPSHLADQGVAVVAAASGGAYVAAESWTGEAASRLLLVRLTGSGKYAWTSKWRTWHDAAITGLTSVSGLALDRAGNVYLAGYGWNPNITDSRGFVQKRGAGGRLMWVRTYRPAGVEQSAIYDFTVSAAGRVWVAGSATPTTGTRDWLLARYETNGDRAWVSVYDSPSHLDDWANAVTLCGTKSLFAGGVVGTATNDDAATAKYLR